MAIWRGAVLTRAGNELLVMAAAGKQIIFTRLVTGCGIYTEEEKDRAALANATALKQQVQEFTFSSYEKHSEQSVLLKAIINNKELTESYTMTEIGVYGKEVGAETDVLCSITVTNSLEESDLFAPYNGLKPDQIVMEYYITLSPDAEVTVNMEGAAALAEDLEALKKDTTKVIVGPIDTEIGNNTILLIVEETVQDFDAVAYDNIILSDEPPKTGDIENWGDMKILTGNLKVGAEPENDTTFFAKIENE